MFYKIILFIVLIGALSGVGLFAYTKYYKVEGDYLTVVKGEVFENVTVSARAKSMADVALGFEFGGKVSKVIAKEGDKVTQGSVLAALDTATQEKMVSKAVANYNFEKQQLKELERGNKIEDIQVSNAEVEQAKQNANLAAKSLVNSIKDAYLAADDAVTNKTDQFFKNPREANPEIFFIFDDYTLKNTINDTRLSLGAMLKNWKDTVDSVSIDNLSPTYYETTLSNLSTIRAYLNQVAKATSLFKASDDGLFVQDQIDKYRFDAGEARSQVAAAYSDLSNAIEQYKLANTQLEVARKQLNLKKSGTSAELIQAQEERVKQAEAELNLARNSLSKTELVSPISGIITDIKVKEGEVVNNGVPVIFIISDNTFEIEADVPEIHVGKIDIGKKANIVFDAFPKEVYSGSIVRIDASPTYIDGLVNYKTTIYLESDDNKRLRNGMTATVKILVNENKFALVLPTYALKKRPEGVYVRKMENGVINETPIKTGIEGDNGFVEVQQGLQEGDIVVVD